MKKHIRYFVFAIFFVVLIICSFFVIDTFALDGASFEVGKKNGEPVIQALENYYLDQGSYPTYLINLVPKYIELVPKPAWRYKFTYDTCSSYKNYVLWFRRSKDVDTFCGYVGSEGKWICSDSMPPGCETVENK